MVIIYRQVWIPASDLMLGRGGRFVLPPLEFGRIIQAAPITLACGGTE